MQRAYFRIKLPQMRRKEIFKKAVSGAILTLLLIGMLTRVFAVQSVKTEDMLLEENKAKDVTDAIDAVDEVSIRDYLDYDGANKISNPSVIKELESSSKASPVGEEKNEAVKRFLFEVDDWSPSSEAHGKEFFFDFQNSAGLWKNGIEPEVGTSYYGDRFCFDDDSIELVVGLDLNIDYSMDAKSVLFGPMSEYGVGVINEVSVGEKNLALIMDVPYQSLQSFTSTLKTLDFVRYVEPNIMFETTYTPNDPDWSLQWGPVKIEADAAWDIQMGNSNVLVAVIDTGIDWNHPDLAANYVSLGYDWVNDDSDPMDDNGHGTHCAGVIAAVLNNSVGIAGLAQVRIMAEKGFPAAGPGSSDDLANGIIHAVDQGAHILSNSWGSFSPSSLIQDAVRYAQDHGVLVLAAAGNHGTSDKHYPAAFDEVVAVTATDSSDLPAGFTGFGDWVEVAAPGVNIYSTVWDDSYTYMSGTSMATPHAAGVAALIWSQFPQMTLNEVRNHLKFSTDDLESPGFDEFYGYGRINALRAVYPPPPHELLILSQETPFLVELGDQARINTTIFNYGTSNETNVIVQLLANGSLVDSETIINITTGTSETVRLSWTPPVDAIYNMTSYIVPVPDENNTVNNAASTLMRACVPIYVLWDDVHDNDGDSLLGNYFSLYKTLSLKGYAVTEHTNGFIDSTLLSDYSILVLLDPEIDFFSSEISDIQSWVDNGGKLLVIPDAGWPSSLNSLLAPYGIQVTDQRSGGGVTTDIAYHPITENVESIYYDAAYGLDADLSLAIALAWTTESYEFLSVSNRVVVLSDSNIMDNSRLGRSDNEKLMTNIFNSIGVKVEHDLSVSLDAPSLISPGESSKLNATVYNLGLHNETDVELNLYIEGSNVKSVLIPSLVNGSSYTFSYLWAPLDEGIINLTVYSPPVADENVTVNNAYSVNVRSVVVPELYVALFKNSDPWGHATNEEVLSFYGLPYEVYSSDDFGSVNLDLFDKVIIGSDQDQSFYDEMNSYGWWFEDYVARGGVLEIHAADRGWHGGQWIGSLPGGLGWTSSSSNYVSIVNVTHSVVTKPFLITDDELDGWGSSVHGYFDAFPEWSRIVINEYYTSLPAYLEFSYGKGTILASSQTLEWGYSHGYSNILENSILYKPEVHSFAHELHVSLRSPNLLLLGESAHINATVYNLGLHNETDVELFILVNDVAVTSLLIPQLDNGTSQSTSYQWIPTVGWYNITAYASPVPGENFNANNAATRWIAVTDLLVYTDDFFNTHSQRYPIVALDNLGITYAHYADDPSGFGTALTSYPWSLVIVSHNNYLAVGNYWNELEAYVLGGGHLILTTFDVDGSHSESTTLWSTLGAEWISDMSSPEPVYRWDPTHPIFMTPNEVGDLTSYSDRYFDNGDHVKATTGTAIAGFTATQTEDHAAILLGQDSRTLLMSFLLSEFSYDEDADGKLDAVELWENAITHIYAPPEHELAVSTDAPIYLKPSDSSLLNATVYNLGLNNETNVELSLMINGSMVNSTIISELLTGESYAISYWWTPTTEGVYNVTVFAPPVSGENNTLNNQASKHVFVSQNPIHFGPLIIDGDQTFIIENVTFTQIGNVYVRDNALLIIRNAELRLNQTSYYQYVIQVDGLATLQTENASITSQYWFSTYIKESATANIDSTIFRYTDSQYPIGYFYAYDNSIIVAHKSTFYGFHGSGRSTIHIHDSEINWMNAYSNSAFFLHNSTIRWDVYFSDSSFITFDDCTVGYPRLSFRDSQYATLYDLHVGLYGYWNIHVNATVGEISYNLTLWNTEITEGWSMSCYDSSNISVYTSTILYLNAYSGSHVSLHNTTILWNLYIRDSSTFVAYNSSIPGLQLYFGESSNVTLRNLYVGLYQYWNLYVNATVSGVGYNLTLWDTTVREGWGLDSYSDSVVSVYNSALRNLYVSGGSLVSIHGSTVSYLSCYSSPVVSLHDSTVNYVDMWSFTGIIYFNKATIVYNWYTSRSECYVYGNVSFGEYVYARVVDSNLTRNYNVQVLERGGSPMENVSLSLFDLNGTLMWSGFTNRLGRANFNLTFTDNDYASVNKLKASGGGSTTIVDVQMLSDTPIIIILTDVIPPSISILNPITGAIVTSTNVTVDWVGFDNETGIDYYLVYLDGELLINTTENSFNLTVLTEGFPPHILVLVAYDKAGNSASEYVYFTVDATAPSIEIFFPKDGYHANDTDLTMVWWGSDAETRIAYYLVFLNNTQVLNTTSTSHDLTGLAEGNYRIRIEAYDLARNTDNDEITITVDNTAPTASINAPANDSYVKDVVIVNITGCDMNIDKMELYISGELKQTWNTSGMKTYNWNTATCMDGLFSVKLTAYDKAGNLNSVNINVIVDNTTPSIVLIRPENDAIVAGNVTIDFYVLDSNLQTVFYALNKKIPVDITGKTSFTIDTSTLDNGSNEIKIIATDKSGNSVFRTLTLVVDNINPSVSARVHPRRVPEGTSISFDAGNSTDNLGIIDYEWDFGDGNKGIGITTSHIYANVGTYEVTLTVKDAAGNSAEDMFTITVLLDTDRDGTPDDTDTDDDNDEMPDTWEIENELNPLDAADAYLDPDGDGLTNLEEYQQGTDPYISDAEAFPLWIIGAVAALIGGVIAVTFLLRRQK